MFLRIVSVYCDTLMSRWRFTQNLNVPIVREDLKKITVPKNISMILQCLSPRFPWYGCGLAASEQYWWRIVCQRAGVLFLCEPPVSVQMDSYCRFLPFGGNGPEKRHAGSQQVSSPRTLRLKVSGTGQWRGTFFENVIFLRILVSVL